jgi:hypothetical protein
MRSRHVGRIVLSDEIVPLTSLRKTLFFDEVLRPQDIAHTALIALAAKDEFMTALNLCRSARQGPLDADGRRLIEHIVLHICRSIRLGLRVDGYSALQRAEFHVLDRLSAGVILPTGARIVYANAAARALDWTRLPAFATRLSRRSRHPIRGAWACSCAWPCSALRRAL